ncbi:MAG: hypothetical protein AAFR54_12925, partial [Planctomycetota bacterium]
MNTISYTLLAAATVAVAPAAAQTTLDIAAVSRGARVIEVAPGQSVDYQILGRLGGDANLGLAMFALDLEFTGGALTQASTPTSGPLVEFVAPRGVNNPAGFGGTLDGGRLVQVGGAMNTIANSFAPMPSGNVVTGIADGTFDELVSGSLVAPTAPGVYALEVSNLFANALVAQAPNGSWRVRGAEAGAMTPLVVEVLDCGVDTYCVSSTSAAGCVATISGSGMASLSGASAATLTVTDVANEVQGLFVWSRGDGAAPLFGGTFCVAQPFTRVLEPALSGGGGVP